MARSGHRSAGSGIALQYGVVVGLAEGPERRIRSRITHGIIRPAEEVGRIHHVIDAVVLQQERPLGPPAVDLPGGDRTALPLGLRVVHAHGRPQHQHRLALHAREVGFQFHAVDPALLDAVEHSLFAGPVGHLALHGMLVAAARKVEVAAPVVIEEDIGVDHRVSGVEERAVGDLDEGAGRRIGGGDADPEILQCTGRILAPVGAEEHVVTPVAFVNLRGPEVRHGPRFGGIAAVNGPGVLPSGQVVGDVASETVAHAAGAIHVVAPVGREQYVGVAQLHVQRIGGHEGPVSGTAAEQRGQHKEQVFHLKRGIRYGSGIPSPGTGPPFGEQR